MAAMFLIYIVGVAYLKPEMAPRIQEQEPDIPFGDKLRITLIALVPTMLLIFTVLGTILLGMATPTEAAACGGAWRDYFGGRLP